MKSKLISRVAALLAATLSVVIAGLLLVPIFAGAQVTGESAGHPEPTIVHAV